MKIYVETFPGLGYVIHIVRYDLDGRRLYRWADDINAVHRFCRRIGVEPTFVLGSLEVSV